VTRGRKEAWMRPPAKPQKGRLKYEHSPGRGFWNPDCKRSGWEILRNHGQNNNSPCTAISLSHIESVRSIFGFDVRTAVVIEKKGRRDESNCVFYEDEPI
jgi:hypothetical protein